MARGRKTDPETRRAIIKDLQSGWTKRETAKRNAVSVDVVYAIQKGVNNSSGDAFRTARLEEQVPVPLTRAKLSTAATRALDDIAYFATRYFGAILQPWQLECTKVVVDLYDSDEEEYLDINAPPGSGKSFFFTRILPAWLTCRNRSIRGMIGSASQNLAKNYTLQLRREFERVIPIKADGNALRRGLACDAESTLPMDFGMFKPSLSDLWRAEQFVVAQEGDTQVTEKEPTWTAVGQDSGFIGNRFDFIIWDDLWDPRKLRSSEGREELKQWYSDVAEPRLDAPGLLILQGQRFGPDDIHRFALDQTMVDDDGDVQGKRYHHLKFKAHYEDRCNQLHKVDAPPYPQGCLLSPRRVTYRRLAGIMKNRIETFEVVYQQEDIDPANVLVNPIWIKGGRDADGFEYPGCWDNTRGLCEIPQGLTGQLFSYATADPSPKNFWAVEWWVYHPDSEQRFLMDLVRQRMDANEFLDWDYNEGAFIGLAEQWQRRSRDLGWPIRYWIIEANAAQRFLLQYDHTRRWQALWGISLIGHETNRNKADPAYGVQSIREHYKWGRKRLPGLGDARLASLKLVDELTRYPQGTTDDCVLADWFGEWNLPRLYVPPAGKPTQLRRPSWMRGRAA